MKYRGNSAKKTNGVTGKYTVNSGRIPRALRARLLIRGGLADQLKLDEDDAQQDGEEEQRHGGALADLPALQPDGERVGGEQVRHVHRAALGEDVHDVEVG